MNKCLNCEKPVKNKYCGVACQNTHLASIRADSRYGKFIIKYSKCENCTVEFSYREREFLSKEKRFCSKNCSSSFSAKCLDKNKTKSAKCKDCNISIQIKLRAPENNSFCGCCRKKRNTVRWNNIDRCNNKTVFLCRNCNVTIPKERGAKRFCSDFCFFEYKKEKKKKLCRQCEKEITKKGRSVYCSDACMIKKRHELLSAAGRKSVKIQKETKRSKNEKYFCELCENVFSNVEHNEPLFNGWDADVIIHDIKVAVLWNGIWHYEKITEAHSVKQVQTRDKIKKQEIINTGYIPYIIKDLGKHNKTFVESEFNKFMKTYQINCI